MREERINFETAKLARERGFNIPCQAEYFSKVKSEYSITISTQNWNSDLYPNCYSAPTQSLLQKWLREEHNLKIGVNTPFNGSKDYQVSFPVNKIDWYNSDYYRTYEQALEKGLQEALKLIK